MRSPDQNRRSRKVLSTISPRTSLENKISLQALLLSYEFELGIDFQRRIIKITDEIDQFTFDLVDGAMTEMEHQSRSDITIKINSPGGSTYDALAVIARIRKSKCKVITEGYGHVMSAATLILASGTRRRSMAEDGFFMWHEASYTTEGRHSQNKAVVAQVEKEEALWAKKMAAQSKKTAKFWAEKGIGTDVFFTAAQLKKFGVVDEVF